MAKRKAGEATLDVVVDGQLVEIMPLGAGQEVGRSCILVKYMGKTVLFDCGIHPGLGGLNSLPFFDSIDMESVDALLITHFHLDHCAALPYVLAHTKLKASARVLMTHPTKAIYHTLLRDFVKVSGGGSGEALYTEKDLDKSMDRIEVIDFHQTVDLGGIKVCPYRAGHVLGAAMFLVEIGALKVLYTGDYSRLADRHLSAADVPDQVPDIVIVEATYGVSRHLPREEREQRFVSKIQQIVTRGGKVLLPVVALGRAQELLLILEEHWARHRELQRVPIYQCSGLAKRALSVYQTYIEMMNDAIKRAFQVANPFVFKHVAHVDRPAHFDDIGACVVMATPSMLQSGLSRDLFEAWCEDPKNGVIIADFAVQGTLARELLAEPHDVMLRTGIKVPLRMSVDAISFSAHADFTQTSEFLDILAPPHVVLVHGEAVEMGRLKKALEQQAATLGIPRNVYTPKVTQPVQIPFKARRTAKIVGRLAEKPLYEGRAIRGLLVSRQGTDTILHSADLATFTKLHPATIIQRQSIALRRPFAEVRLALEIMFEGIHGSSDLGTVRGLGGPKNGAAGEEQVLRIGESVTLTYTPQVEAGEPAAHVVMEWEGGPAADMVADAITAIILQASGEPPGLSEVEARRLAAVRSGDAAAAETAELHIVASLLSAQFGPAEVDEGEGVIYADAGGTEIVVDYKSGKIMCRDPGLADRVDRCLQRLNAALRPCPLDSDR